MKSILLFFLILLLFVFPFSRVIGESKVPSNTKIISVELDSGKSGQKFWVVTADIDTDKTAETMKVVTSGEVRLISVKNVNGRVRVCYSFPVVPDSVIPPDVRVAKK